MTKNTTFTKTDMLREEEHIKEEVYSFYDKEIADLNTKVKEAKEAIDRDNYESQFKPIYASEHSKAFAKLQKARDEMLSMYEKPYFGHVGLKEENGDVLQCLLSENPDLDEFKRIKGADEETYLVPFKMDEKRKIFNALYHIWLVKNGDAVTVQDNSKQGETTYKPEVIREVTISSRNLIDADQFYPYAEFHEEIIDFDDLLAQRLDENRDSAQLRIIISTLQREQYDIVQTDLNKSMVVQGCAGSGKSQCLIHRLFYMRDALSSKGWDKVLLVTPTQLFRNYSAELMRRFHLSHVANTSISELYRSLLLSADSRFRNRQYKFELSEEYLPDEYLKQVYSHDSIQRIRNEISSAIKKYVSEGCRLLEIDYPTGQITTEVINTIVNALNREIGEYELREMNLAGNEEFTAIRRRNEELEKNNDLTKSNQKRQMARIEELKSRYNDFCKLKSDVEEAESELERFKQDRQAELAQLKEALSVAGDALGASPLRYSDIAKLNEYCIRLSEYLDAVMDWGEKQKADATQLEFLNGYALLCVSQLKEFTKRKSANAWENASKKEIEENEQKLKTINEVIQNTENEIANNVEQLQKISEDIDLRIHNKNRRAELERARYFLSRIESSVFEQEVWDALSPLKEQCGIKTIEVEKMPDGHSKETKILYKSDLLFYLRVYMALNEMATIPSYKYICIDEGQDLHSADFETLKEIYPEAVFNIFGDTAQALHIDCGIQDWAKDTGIETIYELRRNYRNTPATVAFCKERFEVNMEPCGKIREEQKPAVITKPSEISKMLSKEPVAVVVKDREAFEELKKHAGQIGKRLNYLDTNATVEEKNTISCFSIFAAKGLEFPNVFVYAPHMNNNQKVVACTRALNRLYYFE